MNTTNTNNTNAPTKGAGKGRTEGSFSHAWVDQSELAKLPAGTRVAVSRKFAEAWKLAHTPFKVTASTMKGFNVRIDASVTNPANGSGVINATVVDSSETAEVPAVPQEAVTQPAVAEELPQI